MGGWIHGQTPSAPEKVDFGTQQSYLSSSRGAAPWKRSGLCCDKARVGARWEVSGLGWLGEAKPLWDTLSQATGDLAFCLPDSFFSHSQTEKDVPVYQVPDDLRE